VSDGFNCLRLNPIIGSYDQNNNIGYGSTPSTHFSKGSMTGSVDKGDFPVSVLNLVRADVLSDATKFFLSQTTMPDSI
jgi:hypothetical protein